MGPEPNRDWEVLNLQTVLRRILPSPGRRQYSGARLTVGQASVRNETYVATVNIYCLLAESWNTNGQYELGKLYSKVSGVHQYKAVVALCCQSAVSSEHPGSLFDLPRRYAKDRGVKMKPAEAARWCLSLALGGDVIAARLPGNP